MFWLENSWHMWKRPEFEWQVSRKKYKELFKSSCSFDKTAQVQLRSNSSLPSSKPKFNWQFWRTSYPVFIPSTDQSTSTGTKVEKHCLRGTKKKIEKRQKSLMKVNSTFQPWQQQKHVLITRHHFNLLFNQLYYYQPEDIFIHFLLSFLFLKLKEEKKWRNKK